MALAIRNGELYNNDDRWKTYRVLNDELETVYEINIDDNDNLYLEETNRPEDNDPIIDEVTGATYFVAIRDLNSEDDAYDAIIYIDTNDCIELCDLVKDTNNKVNEILVRIGEMETQTEEFTSNGWKLI